MQAVERLASAEHATWLANFQREHGPEATREKPRHGNIAVSWECLSQSWRDEQMRVFEVYVAKVSPLLERAASQVHEQWMDDNEWRREQDPHLFVPYEELPEEQKEKDRDVLRTLLG